MRFINTAILLCRHLKTRGRGEVRVSERKRHTESNLGKRSIFILGPVFSFYIAGIAGVVADLGL